MIGRSAILGKPVGMLLLARDATVTYCHSRTPDLPTIVRRRRHRDRRRRRPDSSAATGSSPAPSSSTPATTRATSATSNSTAAADRARLITPVPGGVGPTTIAVLLAQTVAAAESVQNR